MKSFRLLRACLTAGALGVVTAAQLGLPSKGFWDKQVALQWASIAVLTVFVLYEAVAELNYVARAKAIREYEANARAILSTAIAGIVGYTGAAWDGITVRYYRRRSWIRPLLHQVVAVKAGADADEAHLTVKPGVGLVGTAYQEKGTIAEDWDAFLNAARADRAAWEKRSVTERYGLNWGQLQISHRAAGVIASATFSPPDGDLEGCILVAGPLKKADLEAEPMMEILDALATDLRELGSPPRGWWRAHAR